MVTRTVKLAKVFDIIARDDVISVQGFCDTIPGITYANGLPWESDELCELALQAAIEDWKKRRDEDVWGTTSNKPQLDIYWKVVETLETEVV